MGYVEPKTETPGESWLRIIDAGFSRPEPRIWVCDRWGTPLFRLAMGYRDQRLGLEYDGVEFHDGVEDRGPMTRAAGRSVATSSGGMCSASTVDTSSAVTRTSSWRSESC